MFRSPTLQSRQTGFGKAVGPSNEVRAERPVGHHTVSRWSKRQLRLGERFDGRCEVLLSASREEGRAQLVEARALRRGQRSEGSLGRNRCPDLVERERGGDTHLDPVELGEGMGVRVLWK